MFVHNGKQQIGFKTHVFFPLSPIGFSGNLVPLLSIPALLRLKDNAIPRSQASVYRTLKHTKVGFLKSDTQPASQKIPEQTQFRFYRNALFIICYIWKTILLPSPARALLPVRSPPIRQQQNNFECCLDNNNNKK